MKGKHWQRVGIYGMLGNIIIAGLQPDNIVAGVIEFISIVCLIVMIEIYGEGE